MKKKKKIKWKREIKVKSIFSDLDNIPSYVISNKGLELMSNFFCSLGTTLNMQLYFTLGYHPKGDGQTKYTNQTLK